MKAMLRKRIRSTSGATILLALLFFLMCAMAGSVVLSSGSAAAGRIAGIEEKEQAYYTMTSAARLICDEIEGQEFDYYVDADADEGKTEDFGYITEPGGDLKDLLKRAANAIYDQKAGSSKKVYTDEIQIYPVDKPYQDVLSTVKGTFTMNLDYTIEIVLRFADSEKEDQYTCKVVIPALISKDNEVTTIVQESTQGPRRYIRTETALVWSGATIEKN